MKKLARNVRTPFMFLFSCCCRCAGKVPSGCCLAKLTKCSHSDYIWVRIQQKHKGKPGDCFLHKLIVADTLCYQMEWKDCFKRGKTGSGILNGSSKTLTLFSWSLNNTFCFINQIRPNFFQNQIFLDPIFWQKVQLSLIFSTDNANVANTHLSRGSKYESSHYEHSFGLSDEVATFTSSTTTTTSTTTTLLLL